MGRYKASKRYTYKVFFFSECAEIQLELACNLCPLLSNIDISIEYYSYVMPHMTKYVMHLKGLWITETLSLIIQTTVEPVLKDHPLAIQMWSLKTGGLW